MLAQVVVEQTQTELQAFTAKVKKMQSGKPAFVVCVCVCGGKSVRYVVYNSNVCGGTTHDVLLL